MVEVSASKVVSLNRNFDEAWKEVIEKLFPQLIHFFVPTIYPKIDWEKPFVFLDKELDKLQEKNKKGKRIADKIVKVVDKEGKEKVVILHLEVQGSKEQAFPERIFEYFYRIYDKYKCSIYSMAILTDGDPHWRPSCYQAHQWGCEIRLDFPVIKLIDYMEQLDKLEESKEPIANIVAAHLRSLETYGNTALIYAHKVRLIKKLYGMGHQFEEIRVLYEFIGSALVLPLELEQQFIQEMHYFEKEADMSYLGQIEEKAQQKGIQQGKIEGEREAKRKLTLLILESKFGTLNPKQLQQLESTEESALENIVKNTFKASSIEDLLKH